LTRLYLAGVMALTGTAIHLGLPRKTVPACGAPVGSITAFAGEQTPANWLVADGRVLSSASYPELAAVLGTAHGAGYDDAGSKTGDFNLPDLRGRFLRGVDASESGSSTGLDSAADRTAPRPGGHSGNRVGSVQTDATRMPRDSFTTGDAGRHRHGMPFFIGWGDGPRNEGRGRADRNSPERSWVPPTHYAGAHDHPVLGGDRETRPVNIAVRFIICAR